MTAPFCSVYSRVSEKMVRDLLRPHLPDGPVFTIFIKPNWVIHQERPDFPIEALVTDTGLIETIIELCLNRFPSLREINVGDVPIQFADWEQLKKQAGLDRLIEKYRHCRNPRVTFFDLRSEKVTISSGMYERTRSPDFGDPQGYCEIVLDRDSFLEPISFARDQFRISGYDPKSTVSSQRPGCHRYLVARSALNCDLFINVPKMKTHRLAGVTGALKNLVGINGDKSALVHYRKGTPRDRGDEFPDHARAPIIAQVRIKEFLQNRSERLQKRAYKPLKKSWEIIKRIYGIETVGTPENLGKNFYLAGGAWSGNDTLWRMIYDLNRIVLYASAAGGGLQPKPERSVLTILDGITSGEGNGPLQPLAVKTDVIIVSPNPFLVDFSMARLMGFDYRKIPQLKNHSFFPYESLGGFNPHAFPIEVNGKLESTGIDALPILKKFLPPPGWGGQIEAGG